MKHSLYVTFFVIGCATQQTNAEKGREDRAVEPAIAVVAPSSSAQPVAKVIGDPCTGTDGWQRPDDSASTGSLADGAAPVAIPAQDAEPTDTPTLAPGVLFCIQPGGVYPYGYLTSNCLKDADCPSGALCDGSLCRRACSSDGSCTAPTICGVPAGSGKIRFCSCPKCVHLGP